jgi:hypothetical protein
MPPPALRVASPRPPALPTRLRRMAEIDWNTELKKIEREFNGLPPEPSPAQLRAQRAAEQRAQARKTERAQTIGVLARLTLIAALGAALNFWPYARECGMGLYGFLGAEGLLVTGGIWVAFYAWHYRMPRIHLLAAAIVLSGLGLLELEVLPRIGYARTTASWACSDTPAASAANK